MYSEKNRGWADRPLGMRDVFPQQAKYRRQIESKLLDFFERQGIEMVSSGTFEYVDTLLRGRDEAEAEQWVKLFDSAGRTVALRPDMTPSIARMAAPMLASGTQEVRWCYAERVYRRTNDPASISWVSGRAAESTQVGVEWIGASGYETDEALLALCQAGLNDLDMNNWQMILSHAMFAPAFLNAYGIDEPATAVLMQCLATGDYVGFRNRLPDLGIHLNLLSILSALDPFHPDSLPLEVAATWESSQAGLRVAEYWRDLVAFAERIKHQGLSQHLTFDLTLSRELTYYTGIVFEVFAEGVGAPIALGGRYDQLLGTFGASAPAVGFTYEVERILSALTEGAWLHEETGKEGRG